VHSKIGLSSVRRRNTVYSKNNELVFTERGELAAGVEEAPGTDRLKRGFAANLEKHEKMVHFFPVSEDRIDEDCEFFGSFMF
jgi:hypothetical protein